MSVHDRMTVVIEVALHAHCGGPPNNVRKGKKITIIQFNKAPDNYPTLILLMGISCLKVKIVIDVLTTTAARILNTLTARYELRSS